MPDDSLVSQIMKGGLSDLLGHEEIVMEAFRDLLRDEVKRKMREALERNPDLKQELTDSVKLYFEAKVQEYYAGLKFAKASAKLGVTLMPDDLRKALGKEIGSFLEKEVSALLEQSV